MVLTFLTNRALAMVGLSWTPRPVPILAANEGVHNTLLLSNKQLVRKLKLWITRIEVFDRLPRSFSCSTALPLHK
jgi:hypothetical protein